MVDPANRFEHWDNPILAIENGDERLEMCPGTLFMVKFVNWLEGQFPFADNIKPISALGRLLWNDNNPAYIAIAWRLTRFLARYPKVSLGTDNVVVDLPDKFKKRFEVNEKFANGVLRLYRQAVDPNATVEMVEQCFATEDAFADFLDKIFVKISPEDWLTVFNVPLSGSLGMEGGRSLAIAAAGRIDEKQFLRLKAKERLDTGAQFVVMGHTHQPDEMREGDKAYFNPGSWTRYVEIEKTSSLKLSDLKDESRFPYQLNYVRFEKRDDQLLAEFKLFKENKAIEE